MDNGRDLVKRKVRAWVCMGGKFPAGREANFVNGGLTDCWAIRSPGRLRVGEDGEHAHLVKKMRPEKLAATIEELMLRPPAQGR